MMMPSTPSAIAWSTISAWRSGVLPAVEHLQVDAECLRLLFGAGEIGFKEIAGRKVANQRHSDAARFIERGRQAASTGC